jgi:hypothetical protein
MPRYPRLAVTACAVSLLLFGPVGCERAPEPGEPLTLTLKADTIIEMLRDTLPGGAGVTTDCPLTLEAEVAGPAGEYVIVRGGEVRYFWWQTGTPAGTYEWNPQTATRFWSDSVIRVGEYRLSTAHGFGQSEPSQPVRGEVEFRYGVSNASDERRTETLRFFCY